ncbi:MAG: FecR domain-containing protein [Beijerinckiaceae bacterium]
MSSGDWSANALFRRQMLAGMGVGLGAGLAATALALDSAMAQAGRDGAVEAGKVAGIRGTAAATRGSLQRVLRLEESVFVRDLLRTNPASRLQVQLGQSTRLFMGEKTQVTIDDELLRRGGNIHLASGALLFQRKPPDPKPPVNICSPFALLAVRGTTVFAGPSNGVFGVFVEDGEVLVTAANVPVLLRPGEGTNIARPGAPPTPAVVWGKARIDAALASIR